MPSRCRRESRSAIRFACPFGHPSKIESRHHTRHSSPLAIPEGHRSQQGLLQAVHIPRMARQRTPSFHPSRVSGDVVPYAFLSTVCLPSMYYTVDDDAVRLDNLKQDPVGTDSQPVLRRVIRQSFHVPLQVFLKAFQRIGDSRRLVPLYPAQILHGPRFELDVVPHQVNLP